MMPPRPADTAALTTGSTATFSKLTLSSFLVRRVHLENLEHLGPIAPQCCRMPLFEYVRGPCFSRALQCLRSREQLQLQN